MTTPSQLLKVVVGTSMRLKWKSFQRLAIRLANLRRFDGHKNIDVMMDRISAREFKKDRIREADGSIRIILKAKETKISLLGITYYSYECGPDDCGNLVTLNIATDPWFDTYRRARLRKHLRPIALAIDFRDFPADLKPKPLHPEWHRVITLKK